MLYGYQTWSEEPLMQAMNDDDDLCGGQRSTEVKYSEQCSMATKLGQENCWCKLRMMMTFVEVKGQQRSNIVVGPREKKNLSITNMLHDGTWSKILSSVDILIAHFIDS